VEAESSFMKHGAGMRKQLIFCESGSTLEKENESRSKLSSD